jgi:hypothetical protein
VSREAVRRAFSKDLPAWPESRDSGQSGDHFTLTGGAGITVIYGVAAPVKPPRMGKVRTY